MIGAASRTGCRAARGDTPPAVRFAEDGREFRGPGGAPEGPLTATAGEPMPLAVWATDDGVARRPGEADGEPPPLVRLSLHAHQGPGEVTFADPEIEIAEGGPQRVETTATFSEPDEYVLRVFANDRSGGGGSQCYWTNAFVRVTVSS